MKKLLKKYPLYLFSIFTIIVFLVCLISFFNYNNKIIVNKNFYDLDLTNVNKLLIISHPKDEVIWASNQLIEDNYLVVCITCSSKDIATKEFIKVMNKTQDKYFLLGYPEYNGKEKDNWELYYKYIYEDLKIIINLKNWQIIATHNKEGEYGNIQHKKVNKLVTTLTYNKDKLYYFNKYYSKKSISNHRDELNKLNNKQLDEKKKLISIYKSQEYIKTSFNHIIEYEEWINYHDWGDDTNE